jgi:hypothetical protein
MGITTGVPNELSLLTAVLNMVFVSSGDVIDVAMLKNNISYEENLH